MKRSFLLLFLFFLSSCALHNSGLKKESNQTLYVFYSASSAMQVEKLRFMIYNVMANKFDLHIKTINSSGRKLTTELENLKGKKVNFILLDDYKKFADLVSPFELNYNLFAYSQNASYNKASNDPNFIDLSKNENSSLASSFYYAKENGYARIAIMTDRNLKEQPKFLDDQEVLLLDNVSYNNFNKKIEKLESHFMDMARNKETSAIFIDMNNIPYEPLEKMASRLDISGVKINFFVFTPSNIKQGENYLFSSFNNDNNGFFINYTNKAPKEFSNLDSSEKASVLRNLCILQGLVSTNARINKSYVENKRIKFSCLDKAMSLNNSRFTINY
jgi:hypothetical protein